MLKQTALISWAEGADDARRAAVRDELLAHAADLSAISDNLPASANGGDIVWHLHFADEAAWEKSGAWAALDRLTADPAIAHIDAAAYSPDVVKVGRPDIADCCYRTLFVSMKDVATPDQEAQWLSEIRAMPDYIPEILNAATGKVIRSRGSRNWTHVWEQEYAGLADLRGPYMTSAWHWAVVDRWFDAEMPEFIIDLHLCHSASDLKAGVIARYPR